MVMMSVSMAMVMVMVVVMSMLAMIMVVSVVMPMLVMVVPFVSVVMSMLAMVMPVMLMVMIMFAGLVLFVEREFLFGVVQISHMSLHDGGHHDSMFFGIMQPLLNRTAAFLHASAVYFDSGLTERRVLCKTAAT